MSLPLNDTYTNKDRVNVTGIVEDSLDPNPVLTRDGQPLQLEGYRFAESALHLNEGTNVFTFTATDSAGNQSTYDLRVHRKSTPPTISLSTPEVVPAGETITCDISVAPADDVATVKVTAGGDLVAFVQDGQPLHLSFNQHGPSQTFDLAIQAVDIYGNETNLFKAIQVARPHFVFGQVLDDATSKPLAGIPVTVAGPMGQQPLLTDQLGHYQAQTKGLPLTIGVATDAYIPSQRTIFELEAGTRLTDLRL